MTTCSVVDLMPHTAADSERIPEAQQSLWTWRIGLHLGSTMSSIQSHALWYVGCLVIESCDLHPFWLKKILYFRWQYYVVNERKILIQEFLGQLQALPFSSCATLRKLSSVPELQDLL